MKKIILIIAIISCAWVTTTQAQEDSIITKVYDCASKYWNESLIHNPLDIKVLFMNYCDIKQLPIDIISYKNIKYLNLSGNNHLNWEEVFDVLSKFKKLEILVLEDVGLENLPTNIGKLKQLKELHIGYNHITHFPQSLSLLPLRAIKCDYNKTIDVDSLFKLLSIKNMIKEVSLSECNIQTIPTSIVQLKNLRTIDMTGNCFTAFDCTLSLLKKLRSVQLLEGNKCKLTKSIPKCFKKNKSLYLGFNFAKWEE